MQRYRMFARARPPRWSGFSKQCEGQGLSAAWHLAVRDVAQSGSAPEWGSGGRGFKSRRPDWFKESALQRVPLWGCSSLCDPPYAHQAVRRRLVPRRRSAGTRRPACAPAHAAGLARALLTSAPTTRLAERAPVGYITPTICPLRGARWLLTMLLTGFPTTGRANAVFCPHGAAAWTAAIRACPGRWSAAGGAGGACGPIGAPGRSGGSTSRPSDRASSLVPCPRRQPEMPADRGSGGGRQP